MITTTRRAFGILAAAAFASRSSFGQTENAPLIIRSIPKTGERVPAVGLGTAYVYDNNNDQTQRVEAKMQAIVAAHLPKTDAKITFDEGYPAMAVTPAGKELFGQWSSISVALGLGPVLEGGPMTRGAGDIAFVASYVPGLVGVGMLGEGAHAEGEKAYLDSLAPQAKRNAILMERLSREPSGH